MFIQKITMQNISNNITLNYFSRILNFDFKTLNFQ